MKRNPEICKTCRYNRELGTLRPTKWDVLNLPDTFAVCEKVLEEKLFNGDCFDDVTFGVNYSELTPEQQEKWKVHELKIVQSFAENTPSDCARKTEYIVIENICIK